MKKYKTGTTIAVLKNKHGKIVVAADRRISDDTEYSRSPQPKVVKKESCVLAVAGDWGLASFVLNKLKLPKYINKIDHTTFVYDVLIPNLKILLIKDGYVNVNGQLHFEVVGEEKTELEIVAVFKHKVYVLSLGSDYASAIIATEVPVPFATGCGGGIAMGSLLTSSLLDLSVKDRLKLAIETASKVTLATDNDVDYVSEN